MPTREQVERLTKKFYQDAQREGRNVSKEQIREELVKRAKRIDNKKQN